MVRLHVKKGDSDEFLYECQHSDTVQAVVDTVVGLHNRRKTIAFIADNLDAMAEYGPMRPEEERGLEGTIDPNGIRTGVAPAAAETLKRCANDARALIHNRQVMAQVVLEPDSIDEAMMNMKGAVMIAYPEGLPGHDVLRRFEDHGDIDQALLGNDYMAPKEATLWFAGKRWNAPSLIGDYLGTNPKTKVIVRLQRHSSGAPVREPAVDRQTQKLMMSYYHKRQEEQKRLDEDSQDSYLNSEWANPKQAKQSFHGLSPGSIKWRP